MSTSEIWGIQPQNSHWKVKRNFIRGTYFISKLRDRNQLEFNLLNTKSEAESNTGGLLIVTHYIIKVMNHWKFESITTARNIFNILFNDYVFSTNNKSLFPLRQPRNWKSTCSVMNSLLWIVFNNLCIHVKRDWTSDSLNGEQWHLLTKGCCSQSHTLIQTEIDSFYFHICNGKYRTHNAVCPVQHPTSEL